MPADVVALAAALGLPEVAVLAPLPGTLDPAGMDALAADGVGAMDWLLRHRSLRLNPAGLLPTARAMVVAAVPYQAEARDGHLRRARYAAGTDYHGLLRRRLARLGEAIDAADGVRRQHRACADSAPINERTLARIAGLGWVGRNSLVISPRSGSWRFLGVLLTEAPLTARDGGRGADRCGTCTRCETACPTGALIGRRVLSERCISYWTIEHPGVVPGALARRFAGWWFGCDICQEVCPWNRFAASPEPRLTGSDADAGLMAVTEADYDQVFAGRAMRRLGYDRFQRNLLIAAISIGRDDWAQAIRARDGHRPLVAAQWQELCRG
jgi:epoxyqueuosine reductase